MVFVYKNTKAPAASFTSGCENRVILSLDPLSAGIVAGVEQAVKPTKVATDRIKLERFMQLAIHQAQGFME